MRSVLMFSTLLLLISCNNKLDVSKSRISGTFENPKNDFIVFTFNQNNDTVYPEENGTFSYEVSLSSPLMGRIRYGRERVSIVLLPNKDLVINGDGTNFSKSISFEGELKWENKYVQESNELSGSLAPEFRQLFMLKPQEFMNKVDSINNIYSDLIEKYKDLGMSSKYAESEKIDLWFNKYSEIGSYPTTYKSFYPDSSIDLSSNWYDYESKIDYKDPTLIDRRSALSCITWVIENRTNRLIGNGTNISAADKIMMKFKVIDSIIVQPEMNEHFKYEELRNSLLRKPDNETQLIIENYLTATKDSTHSSYIKKELSKWLTLSKGQPAPAWELEDKNKKSYSLVDFKNKYVFIDFWATWCAPCIKEFPYMRKLVDKYPDNKIEFISISIDDDREKWVEFIEKEKLPWLQLYDNKNVASNLYNVQGIPTYVLIDPNGMVVDPQGSKPSSPELMSLLDNLLLN